jgi:ribosomal protein S18 acetylase RimI-like enzyme
MIDVMKASIADMEVLCQIYGKDGMKHSRGLSSYPLMNLLMDDSQVFLIARNPEAVGFVWAREVENQTKIDILSVIETARWKGIEKKLLDEVEKRINTETMVLYWPKSDAKAIEMFKKYGFFYQNEIPNLFGEGETGTYLIKKIGSPGEKTKIKKKKKRAKKMKVAPVLIENLKRLEELS